LQYLRCFCLPYVLFIPSLCGLVNLITILKQDYEYFAQIFLIDIA
jgi:hypothetical protein